MPESELQKTYEIQKETLREANLALGNGEMAKALDRVYQAIQKFDEIDALDETQWRTGSTGEITDRERAELVLKKQKMMLEQAKVLDQLAKTKFEFSRDLHIPIDTMRVWAVKILNLIEKYTMTRKDYDAAVREFKDIMESTRNPNMMLSSHEASAERKENMADG
jgi:uncharacterized protein (UPF0332 family)